MTPGTTLPAGSTAKRVRPRGDAIQDDAEDNFGLVRADFTTKEPVFAAFEKAMRQR